MSSVLNPGAGAEVVSWEERELFRALHLAPLAHVFALGCVQHGLGLNCTKSNTGICMLLHMNLEIIALSGKIFSSNFTKSFIH
jgi:hypothetical protein